MIEVSGLTKRYGERVAIEDLTFTVRRGEIFGLLGPNGAGKTTTMRILSCIIRPDGGTASINGHDILEEPLKVKGIVGLLPERASLYERLTVRENLMFFARLYGLGRGEAEVRVRELLSMMGIYDRIDEPVANLSKGLKQRLSIARALIHDPPVLLLDEPTSGLDPMSSRRMRDLIKELGKTGKTVLLSSHNLGEVELICQRIAVINGRLLAIGSPEELSRKMFGPPKVRILLKDLNERILRAVRDVRGVVSLEASGRELLVGVDDPEEVVPEISEAIVRIGGKVISIRRDRASLEDLFLRVVGEER